MFTGSLSSAIRIVQVCQKKELPHSFVRQLCPGIEHSDYLTKH